MSYGSLREINSFGGFTTKASVLPLPMIKELALKSGYPISVSGSSNVTFNLAAGVTKPVPVWNGTEFLFLKKTLSYTFAAGANNTMIDSTGAVVTSQSPAVGIYYMYLGVTAENTVALYPSTTAPSYVEAGGPEEESGLYGHPGTSRSNAWTYIGFTLCTATTPAFAEFTKIGKTYLFDNSVFTAATAGTSFADAGFTGADALPAHDVEVSGYLETGATAGDATHVSASSAGLGEQNAMTPAAVKMQVPFASLKITGGILYIKHTANAGDVFVTSIEDVV
jgi:hypothetical protein